MGLIIEPLLKYVQMKERVDDYIVRLEKVRDNLIPNFINNINGLPQLVSSFVITMDGLRKVLDSVFEMSNPVKIRKISRKLSAMESRLQGLGPRLEGIDDKVSTIESAYNAADQLPENSAKIGRASCRERV